MEFTRFTADSHQLGGVPCIRRLRIPVATVVGMVAEGMSTAEILEATRTSSKTTCVRRFGLRRPPFGSATFRSHPHCEVPRRQRVVARRTSVALQKFLRLARTTAKNLAQFRSRRADRL
jgi:hypothetical protein